MLAIGIGIGVGIGNVLMFSPPPGRRTDVPAEVLRKHAAEVERLVDDQTKLVTLAEVDASSAGWQESLPEDPRERLITVDFLPVHITRRLAQDPSLLRELTPRRFEEVIAGLLDDVDEFESVLLTRASKDGGKDIIASKLVAGVPFVIYAECKNQSPDRALPIQYLRALVGVAEGVAEKAILVTTTRFSPEGLKFIAQKRILEGKDYDGICGWMHQAKWHLK